MRQSAELRVDVFQLAVRAPQEAESAAMGAALQAAAVHSGTSVRDYIIAHQPAMSQEVTAADAIACKRTFHTRLSRAVPHECQYDRSVVMRLTRVGSHGRDSPSLSGDLLEWHQGQLMDNVIVLHLVARTMAMEAVSISLIKLLNWIA